MKFWLVDRIESIEPGERIVAIKTLTLAEEYLADHFPAFPVMPGVLMIEAMVQTAAWLVRVVQEFSKSVIVLSEVRNARYASFVQPGDVLRCEMQALEIGEASASFKGVGVVENPGASAGGDAGANAGRPRQAVSARLGLRCLNLADEHGYLAEADTAIIRQLKDRFGLIGGPDALRRAAGG